jgi:hypothetical protein
MTMLRLKPMIVAIPVIACAVLLIALAAPAAAQGSACVHLQTGSSFIATMTVMAMDGTTVGPSDSFASGHTQCLPLATIMGRFTVVVQATSGGGSVNCQPSMIQRAAGLSASVTFNASGTPQTISCIAPAAAGAATPELACGQFSANVPNGTYSASCIDCSMVGSNGCTLECFCALAGVSVEDCSVDSSVDLGSCPETELDLTGCNAGVDISNQNGVLSCTP